MVETSTVGTGECAEVLRGWVTETKTRHKDLK